MEVVESVKEGSVSMTGFRKVLMECRRMWIIWRKRQIHERAKGADHEFDRRLSPLAPFAFICPSHKKLINTLRESPQLKPSIVSGATSAGNQGIDNAQDLSWWRKEIRSGLGTWSDTYSCNLISKITRRRDFTAIPYSSDAADDHSQFYKTACQGCFDPWATYVTNQVPATLCNRKTSSTASYIFINWFDCGIG